MTRSELVRYIFERQSYLVVGLDTDRSKLPPYLRHHPDAIFEFNKAIIDATQEFCLGYKINTAFYEAEGLKGWEALEKTVHYIPATHFKIADAKRGDIGNTSAQYAKAFFSTLPFDAITVTPYMGEDSLKPFLEYKNKWIIVLGLTSNAGANDFELQKLIKYSEDFKNDVHIVHQQTERLYERVLQQVSQWGSTDNLMFVVGATKADEFLNIRRLTPDHFYLVPGVGAQGGSLQEISEKAMIADCGLMVAVSRAIIYASDKENFAKAAAKVAKEYAEEMKIYLHKYRPH